MSHTGVSVGEVLEASSVFVRFWTKYVDDPEVYTAQIDVLRLQVLDPLCRAFDVVIESCCAMLKLERQKYPRRDAKPNRIVQ